MPTINLVNSTARESTADDAVKFSIKLTDNSASWLNGKLSLLSVAVQKMATNIKNDAMMTAPRDSKGWLRTSCHVKTESNGLGAKVIFGSARVKYAGYQERGKRYNDDTKYIVKNYTTPGTDKHFLRNAGEKATAKGIRWYLSHS